ncbi:MAG: methionine--tRNA ligase [Candidatus Micrarchaeota archaeon]|nr:methionine--tRNA ligase [Candidatus Micrarchaeota archaeon]
MVMKYLITSALPYVNNVPHLGNIIGCVLSADVFARYCRSRGYETLFICGTDEYGTATETKALEEGLTPQQICDKYYAIHKSVYEWFGISTDIFGRTSTPRHTEITHGIFNSLYKNGFFIEQEAQQPYDEKLNRFLADRFVTGTCPHCGSLDARADQCDKCGRLLTFPELIEPRSKLTGTKPVLRASTHLYLDLAKSQDRLAAWIDAVAAKGLWSENTISIARSWLKEGLKPRAITRDLSWGVSVPLKGYEKKVFYVWFDAPIGYLSITANLTPDWKAWWGGDKPADPGAASGTSFGGPADVRHYEFMGKDNVPFHAIIFPATLLGTGQNWTLPYYISTTEFLNYESGKFSKSKGVGVFGTDAIESGIPADVWRYYLLANRPETSDTTFSWDDFGSKLNRELLANYGNLVNRVLVFISQHYGGKVPTPPLAPDGAAASSGDSPVSNPSAVYLFSKTDEEFMASQQLRYARVGELLEKVKLRDAMHEFMAAASAANGYLQEQAPWKGAKETASDPEKARAATALYVLVQQIDHLAIAGQPFLPNTSAAIFRQLGTPAGQWGDIETAERVPAGHSLGQPEHLFTPLDAKFLDACRQKYAGKQQAQTAPPTQPKLPEKKATAPASGAKPAAPAAPVAPLALEDLQLEVGLIESVERHPNAEKLYVEQILMSNGETRQICSGLVPFMPADALQGRSCVVVKNLKPAKLRGEESQGMILAAEKDGVLEVVSPAAPAGTPIEFEGVSRPKTSSGAPPPFREITIDEFRTVSLKAQDGRAMANGRWLLADGKPIELAQVKEGTIS